MRKTKIICTIGPASEHEDVLTRMIKAGMDVARLNFSHGSHEEHQGKIDLIKKVRQKLHMPIAIMLDTKGPEYRIKTFENGKIELKDGDLIVNASTKSETTEEDKKTKYIRKERYSGSGSRTFYVGKDLTQEDIKAKFEDGVLKLTVPKIETMASAKP